MSVGFQINVLHVTTVLLLLDGVTTKLCSLLLMLMVLLQSVMCNDGAENRSKKFKFHSHTLSRDITEEWVVLTDVIRTLPATEYIQKVVVSIVCLGTRYGYAKCMESSPKAEE